MQPVAPTDDDRESLDPPRVIPGGGAPSWGAVLKSPRAVLTILALINFFNYLDRLIILPLGPLLERELGFTKTEQGLLLSAFVVVHALATVPLGLLADRWTRKSVITIGVAVWSVATAAGAWARSFTQLFVARAIVGIGEATYGPAATALISERYPLDRRARALSLFNLGMVLGSAAGMGLGGLVGETLGWRAAFFVVGVPGLLLAATAGLLYEPRRRAHGEWAMPMELPSVTGRKRGLLVAIFGGGTLVTFFVWGLLFALQHLLIDDYDFRPMQASGFMAAAGAMLGLGVWLGGQLADRSRAIHAGGRLLVSGIGVLVSVPFVLACVWAPSRLVLLCSIVFVVFFASWYAAPVLAALCDAVGETYRATYTAAYMVILHLLGDALAFPVVGWLADRTGSMRASLLALVPFGLAGGLWLLRGARHLRKVAAT